MDVVLKNMLWVAALKECDTLESKYTMRSRSTATYSESLCRVVWKGYGVADDGYYPTLVWVIEAWENIKGNIETSLDGPFEDSGDAYWLEMAEHDADRVALVTPEFRHYTVRPDSPKPGQGDGMGGQRYTIQLYSAAQYFALKQAGLKVARLEDGVYILTTRNLWSQSVIPPKHRHLFPVNCRIL